MTDFRYAFRMLARSPGATAVAVLSLGLGIGANTAIFSTADALLFRPLLIKDLDRIVTIFSSRAGQPEDYNSISPADFEDFREQSHTVEALSAYNWSTVNITGSGEPEAVRGFLVSANFFRTLRADPLIGRTFLDEEGEPGSDQVAVLSQGLWERRFGADRSVVGRTVQIDGRPHQVVGVMPANLRFPPPAEIWMPLALTPEQRHMRGAFYLETVGRLRDGASLGEVQAEIAGLGRRLSEQYPQTHTKRTARVGLLREYVSGNLTAEYMRMLMWAVAFVLLIACANVANLLLARISGRGREFAIRTALGAARWRVVRQLLAESVLLGLAGSIVGVLFALWSVDVMRAHMPPEVEIFLPGWGRLSVNKAALLYTLSIAVAGGVLAGIAPALVGARADVNEGLKSGGRGSTFGRGRHRLRSLLVVSEIVLAVVLLIGAGLLVKGFRAVTRPSPNLEPTKVLTMRVLLPEVRYPKDHDVADFQGRLLDRLRGLTGADSSLITNVPYSGNSSNSAFTIEGREERRGDLFYAQLQSASPDYFRTMRIPLLSGRGFTDVDGERSPLVAVVSETFVRTYFPGENPIGKRFKIGRANSKEPWREIAGVVADIRHEPWDKSLRALIYRPVAQAPRRNVDIVLRAAGDPRQLIAPVRALVYSIDPNQPVTEIKTLDKVISDQLNGYAYVAWMMGIFGVLALALAAAGVYSVMAYSVAERTQEIGVRMALGASQTGVVRMVLCNGMTLAGAGLALGLAAGFGVARLMSTLLFGVSTWDFTALAVSCAVLVASALAACYVPARRAARVDPMIALRYE